METTKLFDSAVTELERMLSSKAVVGEAIKLDGAIIVPLVSVGVGFGAGEATAKNGPSGGTGGGGGVRPIAVLISDKDGVRLETIKGAGSTLSKMAESLVELARERLPKAPSPTAEK